MKKIKKLFDSTLCFCAFGALVLSGCTAEGNDNNNNGSRKEYSNGASRIYKGYGSNGTSRSYNDNGTSSRYGDNGENWLDLNIFEEDDEKEVYNEHGFSRGDIQHLYSAQYDPAKVETIKGRVSKVIRVQYPDNDCYLIALIRSQGQNEVAANLGPVWFANESQLSVDEGDIIQVTGSKLRTNGRFVVLATEVSANGHTLSIRDKQGKSLWGSPKAQKGNADCMIKYQKPRTSYDYNYGNKSNGESSY